MPLEITTDLSNIKNMYETTFLVSPDVSEGDYKKVVAKFEKIIKDNEGEIINLEHWGQRKLAYPIQRKTNAYYCFIEFTSTTPLIGKMEQEFIYDEKVFRYLTVKLDKHAIAFNKKRREHGFGKKKDGTKKEAEVTN